MEIIFTDVLGIAEEYKPVPTFTKIPDWYKNMDTYMSGEKRPDGKGETTATIKKCMPVFDVMSTGYYLLTYTDLWVSQRIQGENSVKTPWFEWPTFEPITFHPNPQAHLHPQAVENQGVPKWINPWSIETPPGYSTLFLPPVHRDNIFVALPGLVDTDNYTPPVNIVFTLKDPNFEGIVPAGTPIAQVIPIKREPWKMILGEQPNIEKSEKLAKRLRTVFFDAYKTLHRQKKEYT